MVQNEFEVEEFFLTAGTPCYMYFIPYMKNTSSCVFTPTAIEGAIVCKHKELSFLYAKKKNYALKYLEKKLLMVKSLKSQI